MTSVLAERPAWMADAYAAVLEPLRSLGPVHEDAVSVGVFLKAERTVAEFRPKARVVHLVLALPVRVDHERLTSLRGSASRHIYRLTLRAPEEVDDEVRDWLRLAYDQASA